ncbi:MAG: hypothetical protein A2W00_02090 [Candidatus Eisenbacteria bacterium RBG_16_71_46]|nr:MAG: hypothetical protein A2W00_02090 [Candidatus Eisenbacteria bacterium RBG_16_71_46]
MPSASRVARLVAAVAVLAALGVVAVWWWWRHPPDPAAELRAHWAPLARVERRAAPELGTRVERWRLVDAAGREVRALWRAAPPEVPHPWTVVMLGGLGTGDRATLLIPAETPAHVLAVDWPWTGRRDLSPLEIALATPAIGTAVLRSPAVVALGAAAAASQPEVDSTRVVLVGASLGVPATLAALRLTRVPAALVLIDGAADLELLLRTELAGAVRPRLLAAPIAALGFRLARPLEPALNAGAADGMPILLINARDDERLPRAAVERLRASFPAADRRWRDDRHLLPQRGAPIEAMAGEVIAWLDGLPR